MSVQPAVRLCLAQGAQALGLDLSALQLDQLLDYLALLQKWASVYNLTALREPAQMLSHHVMDSLAVVGPLRAYLHQRRAAQVANAPTPRLLDVGSGAGLPGVVLAICCPDVTVTCVDAVAKKASFITQVALALKLPNLRGLHARVQTLGGAPDGSQSYDVICSRAFASLADFTAWSAPALAPGGVWMAMKGKAPLEEQAALPSQVQVFHVEHLAVPGLDAQRCLVWMRRGSEGGG